MVDNFQVFCGAVKSADAITGGREKSLEALAFMFKKIEQFDIKDVIRAIEKSCETARNGILLPDILEKLKGRSSDRGAYAWDRVMWAIRQIGSQEYVTFGDPKVHYCIKMLGGWKSLCDMIIDEQVWKRKEFIKLYEDAENRGLTWGSDGIPSRVMGRLIDCGNCNVEIPASRQLECKIEFGKAVKSV